MYYEIVVQLGVLHFIKSFFYMLLLLFQFLTFGFQKVILPFKIRYFHCILSVILAVSSREFILLFIGSRCVLRFLLMRRSILSSSGVSSPRGFSSVVMVGEIFLLFSGLLLEETRSGGVGGLLSFFDGFFWDGVVMLDSDTSDNTLG